MRSLNRIVSHMASGHAIGATMLPNPLWPSYPGSLLCSQLYTEAMLVWPISGRIKQALL